jgi:hypothetical protein
MALSDIWKFIFGQQDRTSQLSNFNPQQNQAFQNYWNNPIQGNPNYQQGSDYLQRLLSNDPQMMQQMQAPYLQNFEQNIVPGIAERFAGMGTGAGATNSSALYNSLGQAGTNLQTQLAGLHSQNQLQGLGQSLNYAQQPYSNAMAGFGVRPFENVYQPGNTGFIGQAGQGFAQGVGMGMNPFSSLLGLFGGGGQQKPRVG